MTDVRVAGLRGNFTFDDAVKHFTGLGGEVVLFDPSAVCGKDHIISAVMHADRAFAEKRNRAKTLLTEIVLYAACERQIGKALAKMKPKGNGTMVAAVLNIKGDLALSELGAEEDDSLYAPSEEKARYLGAEMFAWVSPEDAVLEQVAMVDLMKQRGPGGREVQDQVCRNMKVFVYNYRRFDEEKYFRKFAAEFGFELGYTEESPTLGNCGLADGSDFISVITTPITAEMMDRFKAGGVRMISTRTIGYDHIDLAHAKEIGMAVTHITYEPEGVAEYTVMMILMAIRRTEEILRRGKENDFTLEGLIGGELRDMSVGIVGAGKIGRSVLRDLSGFGCRLYYCNRSGNDEADRYAERVEKLEDLLGMCDIVSLHLELNKDTYHIIGRGAVSSMKEGALLVNTARGPLVDTDALIEGLDSGRIGMAALDVVEDEFGLYYYDCRNKKIENRALNTLRGRPNVLITHHMAFYYENAIRDMVYNSLYGMKMMADGKEIPYRLA